MRNLTAFITIRDGNSNFLRRRSGSSAASQPATRIASSFHLPHPRSRCTPAFATSSLVLPIYYSEIRFTEMVSICFIIRDRDSLRIRSCSCRNAPTIQDSKFSHPPTFTKIRPCAPIRCDRRSATQYSGLDNANSIF